MKPSVHLSRAFGYRELGMYDQSFLELEEIQGDEKWSFEVLESKYLTCKGAKKWEHAEAYSNGMRIYHPNRIDGWINQAECEFLKLIPTPLYTLTLITLFSDFSRI